MFIRIFCKVPEISEPCAVADAGKGAARVRETPARIGIAVEVFMMGGRMGSVI